VRHRRPRLRAREGGLGEGAVQALRAGLRAPRRQVRHHRHRRAVRRAAGALPDRRLHLRDREPDRRARGRARAAGAGGRRRPAAVSLIHAGPAARLPRARQRRPHAGARRARGGPRTRRAAGARLRGGPVDLGAVRRAARPRVHDRLVAAISEPAHALCRRRARGHRLAVVSRPGPRRRRAIQGTARRLRPRAAGHTATALRRRGDRHRPHPRHSPRAADRATRRAGLRRVRGTAAVRRRAARAGARRRRVCVSCGERARRGAGGPGRSDRRRRRGVRGGRGGDHQGGARGASRPRSRSQGDQVGAVLVTTELTGGQLVARVLKQAGVGHVFTLCGGHLLPIYDGCLDAGLAVVDVRHEQSAAHAADAYARLTRNVGVAMVAPGPGVTDAVTGVANAFAARSPVLLIGGAAPLGLRGLGALQEMEQVALLRPITKAALSVPETRQIPEVLTTAIRIALSGRPGPVFVEIPVDLLMTTIEERLAPIPTGYVHRTRPAAAAGALDELARLLAVAERPVIVAGGGVYWDEAAQPLAAFAERAGVPVFMNGAGRGSLPADHPNAFAHARGMALGGADLVLILGAPLDFRLGYGRPPTFGEHTRVVMVD